MTDYIRTLAPTAARRRHQRQTALQLMAANTDRMHRRSFDMESVELARSR
jgi:hypothetical protein